MRIIIWQTGSLSSLKFAIRNAKMDHCQIISVALLVVNTAQVKQLFVWLKFFFSHFG